MNECNKISNATRVQILKYILVFMNKGIKFKSVLLFGTHKIDLY